MWPLLRLPRISEVLPKSFQLIASLFDVTRFLPGIDGTAAMETLNRMSRGDDHILRLAASGAETNGCELSFDILRIFPCCSAEGGFMLVGHGADYVVSIQQISEEDIPDGPHPAAAGVPKLRN